MLITLVLSIAGTNTASTTTSASETAAPELHSIGGAGSLTAPAPVVAAGSLLMGVFLWAL